MSSLAVGVGVLGVTAQEAVRAMFWGAIVLAAVMPIAAAAGTVVAKKIDKNGGQKQSKYDHYSK